MYTSTFFELFLIQFLHFICLPKNKIYVKYRNKLFILFVLYSIVCFGINHVTFERDTLI